ncbi:esterase/lipase family protein [Massilia timonae]|uniref:esterase/lipase family protein n=1 Tax=Massilia timonae TaxID=47229 RepID=UPI002897E158|nr:hypothetical protein [Massilia timonae]
MNSSFRSYGYKLPVNPQQKQGSIAQGFVTPKKDRTPQVQCIPPKRVLPIVFIPGIMGSNLRMNQKRQDKLKQKHNISWRPDNSTVTIQQFDDTPAERQSRLDPKITEVDIYEPEHNRTGNSTETADQRNEAVRYSNGYGGWRRLDGPLLQGDLPGSKNGRTQDQKARARGWGEVYFGSYQSILATCENKLNSAFSGGSLERYLGNHIVGVDPSKWQAHPNFSMKPLDENYIREAVKECWFPVHAMGYNWLKSNRLSGIAIAKRICSLIENYRKQGFECEKVILVTHSMGGLVARAAIHSGIGKISDKVLGIVHGVMPAVGAGAAYKRMRCGVEASWYSLPANIGAGVLGNNGEDVTAVLAGAPGALELLPSRFYGMHWLELRKGENIVNSWPEKCPYEEIYKVTGKWYGLFKEEWINPAGLVNAGVSQTLSHLDGARMFHEEIADVYHENSYAHYGSDVDRKAWYKVVWRAESSARFKHGDSLRVVNDDRRGELRLVNTAEKEGTTGGLEFDVEMQAAAEAGDQTVPLHSGDAQLRSGKFKGIFRQSGYEHQASYDDPAVISATSYCLFKIISEMKWSKS